ncbi:MAG: hypothetical protein AB1393_01095 [Candidatus Edwardsbacteria bacterium]
MKKQKKSKHRLHRLKILESVKICVNLWFPILFVAIAGLGLWGCSSLTPTPDVRVVGITSDTPLSISVSDTTKDYTVTLQFVSMNKVDAIITQDWASFYRNADGTGLLYNETPRAISFFITGTDTVQMKLEYTRSVIAGFYKYMTANGISQMNCKWNFYGEDAYGYKKTFYVETPRNYWINFHF